MGAKLSLFGYYTLNYANSDTSGASSIPSNPFDLQQDYGRHPSMFAIAFLSRLDRFAA